MSVRGWTARSRTGQLLFLVISAGGFFYETDCVPQRTVCDLEMYRALMMMMQMRCARRGGVHTPSCCSSVFVSISQRQAVCQSSAFSHVTAATAAAGRKAGDAERPKVSGDGCRQSTWDEGWLLHLLAVGICFLAVLRCQSLDPCVTYNLALPDGQCHVLHRAHLRAVASLVMGHGGTCPSSTPNNFIFSSLWSKSDSQLSKIYVVCEISWCKCQ